MENLLLVTKNACDLYLHGTIESPTPGVHRAFSDALTSALTMQDGIYKQMTAHGWYQTEQATQQELNKVRSKYAAQA
ncbi:MAG: spore coat protein [Ruminococcaceae bacterium]|nr:spore coat protein [Oscillospiraceae bacterium]